MPGRAFRLRSRACVTNPGVRFKYNAEIIFSSEGYSSKASARNAIDSIQKNGPGAPTEDNS